MQFLECPISKKSPSPSGLISMSRKSEGTTNYAHAYKAWGGGTFLRCGTLQKLHKAKGQKACHRVPTDSILIKLFQCWYYLKDLSTWSGDWRVHNLHSIVLIQVLFHTKTNNSNLNLDQLVVKKLNALNIYSHSLEVWNPEFSVPTIQL